VKFIYYFFIVFIITYMDNSSCRD